MQTHFQKCMPLKNKTNGTERGEVLTGIGMCLPVPIQNYGFFITAELFARFARFRISYVISSISSLFAMFRFGMLFTRGFTTETRRGEAFGI